MFKDREAYKTYLEKQEISEANLDEYNYFQHAKNGELIIKSKEYNISGINVEDYTNCINWILLKDNRTMALLKRPFGDVYRNLQKGQYYISLYNNILLPQIAKQFQEESAIYYIVQGNELSNKMKHLLTIDFKKYNEELIHGEEILEQAGGDINEDYYVENADPSGIRAVFKNDTLNVLIPKSTYISKDTTIVDVDTFKE